MNKLLSFKILLLFLFCNLLNVQILAQEVPLLDKLLFVGNSYTSHNNLPSIIQKMLESQGYSSQIDNSTFGGARLSEHWRNGNGWSGWDIDTKDSIANNNYDSVVFQEQSLTTIEAPNSFLDNVKLFSDYTKAKGSKVYLYMTWARETGDEAQYQTITSMHTKAGELNNVSVVPVGIAWKEAISQRPDIELYHEDGSHPSAMGSYLAACVFYAYFTLKSPIGLPNEIKDVKLSIDDASFLQNIACEVVRKYNNITN